MSGVLDGIAVPVNLAATCIGFPFEIRRCDRTGPRKAVLIASRSSLWKTLLLVSLALSRIVLFATLYYISTGGSFRTGDFARAGLTLQDLLVITWHDFIGCGAAIALAAIAKRTSYATEMAAMAARLEAACSRNKKSRRKFIRVAIAWALLQLVLTAIYFGNSYLLARFLQEQPITKWLVLLMDPIYSLFAIGNPWLAMMILFESFFVGLLAEEFGQLRDDLGNVKVEYMRPLVEKGLELYDLTLLTNTTLGILLLISLCALSTQLCSLLYLDVGLIIEGKISLLGYNITTYAIKGAMVFLLIYHAHSSGQAVGDSMREVREEARKLMTTENDDEGRLELLVKRLGSPNPMAPKGFFTLDYSGLLGEAAVMTTYMIVLLQFRST